MTRGRRVDSGWNRCGKAVERRWGELGGGGKIGETDDDGKAVRKSHRTDRRLAPPHHAGSFCHSRLCLREPHDGVREIVGRNIMDHQLLPVLPDP